MAEQPQILKGILKNRSEDSKPPSNPRELAVQHATILQHRKDVEAQVLASVILLSELPTQQGSLRPASDPLPSDATLFKQHVRLFQPSDYDDLIEERNAASLCGYTLCGESNRQSGSKGDWKITGKGQIVKKKDYEKWCSPECARRALYVKVQLNENAAWERIGIPEIEIELFSDTKPPETSEEQLAKKASELKLEDQRQAARDQAALAIERGEPGTANHPALDRVVVKEKEAAATDDATAVFDTTDGSHLAVEGYTSKLETNSKSKQ